MVFAGLQQCEAQTGGAVWLNGSSAYVCDSVFKLNQADASAVGVAANALFRRCEFVQNAGTFENGGLQILGAGVVEDSVFRGNRSGLNYNGPVGNSGASALHVAGSGVVSNCTFKDNETWTEYGGAIECEGGEIQINNSIAWGNWRDVFESQYLRADLQAQVRVLSGEVQFQFCTIKEWDGLVGVPGSGNNGDNPQFDAQGRGRLLASSTCIDSGLNAFVSSERALDLDRNARIAGVPMGGSHVVDRGCFERVVGCYANCDGSAGTPLLTANDLQCFLNAYSSGDPYANCDGSTGVPILTANDFQCFLNKYLLGCE